MRVSQNIGNIFLGLVIIGFGVCSEPIIAKGAEARPNIIVFMVDDLGWNHIGVEKATLNTAKDIYKTPNLDKLANGGLSFTHAYAQPNCAPTRAAMLSGQYPARINNDVYVVGHLNRYGNGGLTENDARFRGPRQSKDVGVGAVTVAEALKRNGYMTAHIGKYHVGGHAGDETMPENVGFDINVGGFSQGNQATCFASKREGDWVFEGTGLGHFDKYAEPYSASYLEKRKLPSSLLGTKKHISDALGDALRDTIAELSSTDRPFYLQFHPYAVHSPVRARSDLKLEAINIIGDEDEGMADYIGFILGVDENIGRVIDAVRDPNGDGDDSDSIESSTLILFTSDNGGTHTDNYPLRGVKGMITEGGIRVPLIAYWPGVIPENTVTDYMVHSVDYYPTFIDLAGGLWGPSDQTHPLDGESFMDILENPKSKRRRGPIFYLFPGYMDWRAEPFVTIIDDIGGKRLKLSYFYEDNAWELYDLNADYGETSNIVKKHASSASILSRKIDEWLRKTHSTWNPKYPLSKDTGVSVGPPGFIGE